MNMDKINYAGGLYTACIFLGTVIGAGFATGQEAYQFFASFGTAGLFGVVFCGILFYFICKNTLHLGARVRASSFLCFLLPGPGPAIAHFFHMITTSFLFVVFGVMGSALATLGTELFHSPPYAGFLLYLFIMAFLLSGSERYLSILSVILCPIMIFCILFLCLYVLIGSDLSVFSSLRLNEISSAPFLSALLYCGYNALSAIPILSTLHTLVPNKKTARFSALLCAGVFGMCLFLLTLALSGFYGEIKSLELPLLYVATLGGDVVRAVYFIILLCAILTTGAGCGFVLRKSMGERRGATFIICSSSFVFCLFNFSFLVSKLYAFFGFFGIVLIALIILENRRQSKLCTGD